MPYNIPINQLDRAFPRIRVKYKDIFDLKEFYDAFHEYLLENEWMAYEKGPDDVIGDERFETYYDERINKEGMKELRMWWRLKKKAPAAQYLTYYLDVTYKCLAIVNTEVVRNGHKLKMQKGEIEVAIDGYIDQEWKREFKKSILREISLLFKKRIYKKTFQQRKKELYQEAYAMNNFIKQWFKLKRYLPYEETKNFFTSGAYPSHLKEDK
jgi:hypothetical protein